MSSIEQNQEDEEADPCLGWRRRRRQPLLRRRGRHWRRRRPLFYRSRKRWRKKKILGFFESSLEKKKTLEKKNALEEKI